MLGLPSFSAALRKRLTWSLNRRRPAYTDHPIASTSTVISSSQSTHDLDSAGELFLIICLGETRIYQAIVGSRVWGGPSVSKHLPAPLSSASALVMDEGLADHLATASTSTHSLNATTTNELASGSGSTVPKFAMLCTPSNHAPRPNSFPRDDKLAPPLIPMETALLNSPAGDTNHGTVDGTKPRSNSSGNMINRSLSVDPPLYGFPLSVPSATKMDNAIPPNGFLAYSAGSSSFFPSQSVTITPQIGPSSVVENSANTPTTLPTLNPFERSLLGGGGSLGRPSNHTPSSFFPAQVNSTSSPGAVLNPIKNAVGTSQTFSAVSPFRSVTVAGHSSLSNATPFSRVATGPVASSSAVRAPRSLLDTTRTGGFSFHLFDQGFSTTTSPLGSGGSVVSNSMGPPTWTAGANGSGHTSGNRLFPLGAFFR